MYKRLEVDEDVQLGVEGGWVSQFEPADRMPSERGSGGSENSADLGQVVFLSL